MSRRIFLSDMHVSAGHSLVAKYPKKPYDWFTHEDSKRTIAFLQWVLQQADPAIAAPTPIDEVVLLGDIFDNWVYPHDEQPPTLRQIISSENAAPVVAALRQIAENTRVFFVTGNHDMTLGPDLLAEVSPQIVYGASAFASGRVTAEHGNREALCCAPDPDRRQGLPLGYFISRLAATSDRELGTHNPTLPAIMRELIDVTEHERLGEAILDAVCARLHLNDSTKIEMPEDLWGGEAVTIGSLKPIYGDIYAKWVRRNGTLSALRSLPAELGMLEPFAGALMQSGATNAVVLGHTHDACAKGFVSLRGRSVYANTGAWCGGKGSWVEVLKDSRKKGTTVTCMGWKDGGAKVIDGPVVAD